MDKIDTRKLSSELQQHNRNLAIRMFNSGHSRQQIAEVLDVHYGTVCRWIRGYQQQGETGFQLGKRGRRTGEDRLLTPAQEDTLQQLLREKCPDQLNLPFALWSRPAIKALIWQRWRVKIATRTLSTYLARWGFTPQKPAKQAYEQCDKAVQQWLDTTYPFIQARAKLHYAEIFWGDETGIKNQCQHQRGFAPKGQTPVVRLNAKRFSVNMMSAINNQGKVRFMVYEETMTTKVLLRFFKRLIASSRKKVFLILDNLRVHHAKLVRSWLEKHKQEIEVFYLPSYSPELNPDEYLNGDLKQGIRASSPARSHQDLKAKVTRHMKGLQNKPDRVKKYFKHPLIRYAA
ncbi:IS630 family transposase [Zobellella endophytica]|uniref:IS630 family transposase n=1 Tax=Zobellella endophytica TaxID=2116700 RepID=A0A2P7RB12_9GAMM|nr:IS630 family transposase [Zobellella endophytica]PSJ47417.1 IS630 family transposase [Zobellella endophytica]